MFPKICLSCVAARPTIVSLFRFRYEPWRPEATRRESIRCRGGQCIGARDVGVLLRWSRTGSMWAKAGRNAMRRIEPVGLALVAPLRMACLAALMLVVDCSSAAETSPTPQSVRETVAQAVRVVLADMRIGLDPATIEEIAASAAIFADNFCIAENQAQLSSFQTDGIESAQTSTIYGPKPATAGLAYRHSLH